MKKKARPLFLSHQNVSIIWISEGIFRWLEKQSKYLAHLIQHPLAAAADLINFGVYQVRVKVVKKLKRPRATLFVCE